jgi:hypothetical protein
MNMLPNNENTNDMSAGSHGDQCRCGLATRLVGDGCEHCNPAMMIDILREQVAEMRLTEEERRGLELMRDLALAQCQGEDRYLMVRAACSILARSGRSSTLDE